MKAFASGVAVASLVCAVAPACAEYVAGVAIVHPALTGTTQYDGWIAMSSTNYPGYGSFPGSAPWPAPIGSNRTPANTFNASEPADAGVMKTANGAGGGGPLPLSGTIYFGGFDQSVNTFGGTLAVSDATPVPGLATVVFQVQIGEAWTYDFYNHVLPTLSYNGGSQRLPATRSFITDRYDNGTVQMPSGTEHIYNNTYLLQWDLRAIAGPITAFAIEFSGVQHAQVYGMALDQSDTYTEIQGPCYANCDGSVAAPALNVADFTCFLQKYSGGDSYANCDGSTAAPALNVADFTCFLQKFSAGCN
jgi:hypothetical protein